MARPRYLLMWEEDWPALVTGSDCGSKQSSLPATGRGRIRNTVSVDCRLPALVEEKPPQTVEGQTEHKTPPITAKVKNKQFRYPASVGAQSLTDEASRVII